MLDLYSGLGGASEAFVQAGWDVIRIENNPELSYVPFTRTLDVNDWADWAPDLGRIDLIWASPPCREFSTGYSSPMSKAIRAGNKDEYDPDLTLVMNAIDIIEYLKPKWWIIENVRGAVRYFEPLLDRPKQNIGPFCLWTSGSVPYITMPYGFTHSKMDGDTWSTDPLRANRRAMIPFEVSFALLRTIREQTTMEDFL